MSNKEGQKFLCFLPKVEEAKTVKLVTQQNTSNMIVETERRDKLKTPDELLEVLKDGHSNGCFIRVRIYYPKLSSCPLFFKISFYVLRVLVKQ